MFDAKVCLVSFIEKGVGTRSQALQFTFTIQVNNCNLLQKSGKLNCSSCSKYFKTTGALRRQRHSSKSETQLEKDTTQQIFQETISDLLADECYPNEIKIELKTFIPHENQITTLFEEIKPIYEKFCKSSNAEQFFMSLYSNILKCSEKYIELPHPLCVTVVTRFGEKLLAHIRRKQNEVVFNDPINIKEIIEREMGGLQYLAGYAVTSLINKLKSKKHQGDSVK